MVWQFILRQAARAVTQTALPAVNHNLLAGLRSSPTTPALRVTRLQSFPTIVAPLARKEFQLKMPDISRDDNQGNFGNSIPLDHNKMLRKKRLHETIAQTTKERGNHVIPGEFEIGGATNQVASMMQGQNPTTSTQRLSQTSLYSKDNEQEFHVALRPLWRGRNGPSLKPHHNDDLRHIEATLAYASFTPDEDQLHPGQHHLQIKAFDSQGIVETLEDRVRSAAELKSRRYRVVLEIAIPYSNPDNCQGADYNPYPTQEYVDRARAAIRLTKKYDLTDNEVVISLKDMAGELTEANAPVLYKHFIELMHSEGVYYELGAHLHDTGLALNSAIAIVKLCKENQWRIAVDSVGGQDTGFINTLELIHSLEANGIPHGFTEEEIQKFEKIEQLSRELQDEFKWRRIKTIFTGKQLRTYQIPGGGFASFYRNVQEMGLAKNLGLSEKDAMILASEGLIAVSKLMGYPFGVTPGFQNKVLAALNLLTNMIEQRMVRPEMSLEDMIDTVLQELTNQQVHDLFLKNLNSNVQKFLQGEMPGKKHPEIVKALGVSTEDDYRRIPSELPDALNVAEEAQHLGLLKPTPYDIIQTIRVLRGLKGSDLKRSDVPEILDVLKKHNATYERYDGQESHWFNDLDAAIAELVEIGRISEETSTELKQAIITDTRNCGATHAITVGGPHEYLHKLRTPWHRKLEPSEVESLEELQRADKRFLAGLRTPPDLAEKIRSLAKDKKISLIQAKKLCSVLLEDEYWHIATMTTEYMSDPQITHALCGALASSDNQSAALQIAVKDITKQLYANIKEETIKHTSITGEQNFYGIDDRLDIAVNVMLNVIEQFAHFPRMRIDRKTCFKDAHDAIRDIKKGEVLSPMPGSIVEILVKKGDNVQEGNPVAIITAMKMELIIRAGRSGTVGDILCTPDSVVMTNQEILRFDNATEISQPIGRNGFDSELRVQHDTGLAETMSQFLLRLREVQRFDHERTKEKVRHIEQQIQEFALRTPVIPKELTPLEKMGYFGKPFELPESAQNTELTKKTQNAIHVILNRANFATLIASKLRAIGCNDVRVMHTEGDRNLSIIQGIPEEHRVLVNNYTDVDAYFQYLNELAAQYPDKLIAVHLGAGFLSEDAAARRRFESLPSNVVFTAPNSTAMKEAGDKSLARQLVHDVSESSNPPFFEPKSVDADDIRSYIASIGTDEQPHHPLDSVLRSEFEQVLANGGDMLVKGVAGGGGKAIWFFQYDNQLTPDENYEHYLNGYLGIKRYAAANYGNDKSVVEGNVLEPDTNHIEVQAQIDKEGQLAFFRNCTKQVQGQKDSEFVPITGDLSPELNSQLQENSKGICKLLADKYGYKGAITIEFLVSSGKIKAMFLEMNTRLQVEHPITDFIAEEKTGKPLSMVLVNTFIALDNSQRTARDIFKQQFGYTDEDLEAINRPSSVRGLHFRINSKKVDFRSGTNIPQYFEDEYWLGQLSDLARRHNVCITKGGLGDGKNDAQIGALWGKEQDVIAAAKELRELFQLSAQIFERVPDTTNLDTTPEFYEGVVLGDDGLVNPHFSTGATDALLKEINEGHVNILQENTQMPPIPGQINVIDPDAARECIQDLSERLERAKEARHSAAQRALSQFANPLPLLHGAYKTVKQAVLGLP